MGCTRIFVTLTSPMSKGPFRIFEGNGVDLSLAKGVSLVVDEEAGYPQRTTGTI